MAVEKFEHEDGRTCTYSSMTGEWYHWDDPKGIVPGPRDRVEYRCERHHPGDSSRYKVEGTDETKSERGEFGMPHMGIAIGDIYIPAWTMGPGSVFVMSPKYPTGPKQERVCNIMDEAQTLYKQKAAGYRGVEGDTADHLGAKGQFADINRKFWRLKAMLWDEVVPMYPDAGAGESVEEILMDFIGHAALTIDYIRQSEGQKEDGKA